MESEYKFCEFFPEKTAGDEFYILGMRFVKTGEVTADGPCDTEWVYVPTTATLVLVTPNIPI
jgi:hypothetical protein